MKKIITLICTILLLAACAKTANNNYIFSGESEHWKAEYTYNAMEIDGQTEDHYRLIVTYKGPLKELSSLKKLEYDYETLSSQGSVTENFVEAPNSEIFSSSGSSKGGAGVAKDEVIHVHVKWGDMEETLELRNQDT